MAEEDKKAAEPAHVEAEKTVEVPPKKSGGSNKTLVIVLVIVFVVFVLPGMVIGGAIWWFGRGKNAENLAESIIESSTGSDVDIDSKTGEYSIKSDDGSAELSTSEELPDNFPSEVPLYKSQTITSSYRTSSTSSDAWSVVAESNDSVSKVEDYLEDKFSDWTNKGEYSVNGTTTTTYEKGEFSVSLTVGEQSGDTGKTSISYLVTKTKD